MQAYFLLLTVGSAGGYFGCKKPFSNEMGVESTYPITLTIGVN